MKKSLQLFFLLTHIIIIAVNAQDKNNLINQDSISLGFRFGFGGSYFSKPHYDGVYTKPIGQAFLGGLYGRFPVNGNDGLETFIGYMHQKNKIEFLSSSITGLESRKVAYTRNLKTLKMQVGYYGNLNFHKTDFAIGFHALYHYGGYLVFSEKNTSKARLNKDQLNKGAFGIYASTGRLITFNKMNSIHIGFNFQHDFMSLFITRNSGRLSQGFFTLTYLMPVNVNSQFFKQF